MLRARRPLLISRRRDLLRRGIVLAFLALLCQTVLAFLALSAEAEAGTSTGSVAICGMKMPGDASGGARGHGSHAAPDCPICQAVHLASHLVPPAPVMLAPLAIPPSWRALPANTSHQPRRLSQPQQARGPPPV